MHRSLRNDSRLRDQRAEHSGVTLSSDNVFGDGWDAELATVTGDPASGMTVALTIGVGEKSTSAPPPEVRRAAVRRRKAARPDHPMR